MNGADTSLWVFGYGSLCWNPGFNHGQSVVGSIGGFARRFWQGNTTHRGVPGKPGRVATLIEERNAVTHGIAFQLLGESALDYLNNREVTLGGYVSHITIFQPKDPTVAPFPVLLYVATPSNQHWLGPAPLENVADQVVWSSGNSGHNVEYVLRLCDWMRETLPNVIDEHLYTIEGHIRQIIREKNLCLKSMMSSEKCCDGSAAVNDEAVKVDDSSDAEDSRSDDEDNFRSKVQQKKLRCVKV